LIPQFYHSFKEHQSFPSDTEWLKERETF
jgi:hypothetical protein